MLRMGYGEVVFIQSGGKLDTMWRGAWQRLATRHQGEMYCSRYKWSLQQDGAPSHTARNTQTCRVRSCSSLSQTFCPPSSPDFNSVNLITSHLGCSSADGLQCAIIKVSPLLTKWRTRLSKAWQKLPHGAVIANSSLLSPFYLRLILFASWRHYFPRLIQINYVLMFRMKRPRFVPNLVKIC